MGLGDIGTFGDGEKNDVYSPPFDTGELEFHYEDGEVAIYGTPRGLLKLAEFCSQLAQVPESKKTKHVHLKRIINSLQGIPCAAVAVFHRPVDKS